MTIHGRTANLRSVSLWHHDIGCGQEDVYCGRSWNLERLGAVTVAARQSLLLCDGLSTKTHFGRVYESPCHRNQHYGGPLMPTEHRIPGGWVCNLRWC